MMRTSSTRNRNQGIAWIAAAACAAFCLICPRAGIAAWSDDPNENTPVVVEPGSQGAQQILYDGQGGYFVVWHDSRNGEKDVYAQHFDADGAELWTAAGVAVCELPGEQSQPKVSLDGAGGIIVTWEDAETDMAPADIHAQRIDADGVPQWDPEGVAVIATPSWDDYCGWTVSDGQGGAFVMSYEGLVNRVVSDGSLPWDSPVDLSQEGSLSLYAPKIVSDNANGAILCWQVDEDVAVQRIDSSGNLLWNDGEFVYLTSNGGTAWSGACPRLLPAPGGGAFVVWRLSGEGMGEPDIIQVQKLDSDGSPQWDSGINVAESTELNSYSHDLASDGAGGVFVTWAQDDTMFGLYIDSEGGLPWDGPVQLGAAGDFMDTSDPSRKTVEDGSGGFITAWIDSSEYVRIQRCDAEGNLLWGDSGTVLSYATSFYCGPRLATNGQGGAVTVWGDERGDTGNDIYIQGISAEGALGDPGYTPVSGGSSGSSGLCFAGAAVPAGGSGALLILLAAAGGLFTLRRR